MQTVDLKINKGLASALGKIILGFFMAGAGVVGTLYFTDLYKKPKINKEQAYLQAKTEFKSELMDELEKELEDYMSKYVNSRIDETHGISTSNSASIDALQAKDIEFEVVLRMRYEEYERRLQEISRVNKAQWESISKKQDKK